MAASTEAPELNAATRLHPTSKGPLGGLRVLEFAGLGPAPFAAMMLADLGADVIEIVKPGSPAPDETDFFLRGRRRVELDLKRGDGVEAAAVLAAKADVLVEGYRPGVMERLGLGPEPLLRRSPGLVYARMTGWGQHGARASVAGHDINYIAVAGALHCMRSDNDEPVQPLNLVGDIGGALYLVAGVLAALIDRSRTGEGQIIDAAITDCVAHMLTPFYAMRARGNWSDEPGVNVLDGGAYYYRSYRCSDGRYISIGPIEPRFRAEMLSKLGLDDHEFPDRADEAGAIALKARIASRIATRTRAEWSAVFDDADACVSPVLDLGEATRDQHARDRNVFGPDGDAPCAAPAPRFSAHPDQVTAPVSRERHSRDELIRSWTCRQELQPLARA